MTKNHPTICWECEWAGGKDEKCPWANKFEPVPGWKAIPTKILIQGNTEGRHHIDSYDVYECPLFELMGAIKRRTENNARHFQRINTEETIREMKALRSEGKTYGEIANIIGISERTIFRLCKKESAKNEQEI